MKSNEAQKLGAALEKKFTVKEQADLAQKRTGRSVQAQATEMWRDITVNGCSVVIISSTGDFS